MAAQDCSIGPTLVGIRSSSSVAKSPPARRALGGVVTAPMRGGAVSSIMYLRCVMGQTHSEAVNAR